VQRGRLTSRSGRAELPRVCPSTKIHQGSTAMAETLPAQNYYGGYNGRTFIMSHWTSQKNWRCTEQGGFTLYSIQRRWFGSRSACNTQRAECRMVRQWQTSNIMEVSCESCAGQIRGNQRASTPPWLGYAIWGGHPGGAELGCFLASLAVVGTWGDQPPSGVVGGGPRATRRCHRRCRAGLYPWESVRAKQTHISS
jgi:hypothetical protein